MAEHRKVQHDCTWLLIVAGLLIIAAVTLITIEASARIAGSL